MRLILGLLITSAPVLADDLKALTERNGFKTQERVINVIRIEAQRSGLDASQLVRIAMIESGLDINAWRVNKNNTVDVGLFQINSVNFLKCKGLDINSLEGNVKCAVKILKAHHKHADTDFEWICRYHSKTPSRKAEYCKKLASLN